MSDAPTLFPIAEVPVVIETSGVDARGASPNPCVRAFGAGPADRKCGECTHLISRHWDKRYYKCDLRKITNGPGSDHRVRWPACAKFQANTQR